MIKQLFGSRYVNIKGEQPVADQRALYWMATHRPQPRSFQTSSCQAEIILLREAAWLILTCVKFPKVLSLVQTADSLLRRLTNSTGPASSVDLRDALKQSHVERLRKKWMAQRNDWRDDLYSQ